MEAFHWYSYLKYAVVVVLIVYCQNSVIRKEPSPIQQLGNPASEIREVVRVITKSKMS